MPSGLIGVSVRIAAKNGIVIRARKSGATCVSVNEILLPLTLMPDADEALPASTSAAPLMSPMNDVAGELIFGCRSRLNAYAKFAAVTGEPSANFRPLFTVNVYVLPSFETVGSAAAASGVMRVPPAEASLSGKFSSLQ